MEADYYEPYGISEVFDATIELITKYGNGISLDVKQYVFGKCGNTVTQHFDDFEGILKVNPELFDDLFPEYSLESIRKYSFKNTLNVIAHLRQNPNSSFFEKLSFGSSLLLVHSLCYGAAVFIRAFSEKILRLCYFEEMKDSIYIPLNKSTIGNLLSDGNEAMTKILGKYQLKHLNYYLGQDKDGNVGMSYRNRLAHWAEINENYLTQQLVCQLFYLFTCIINPISLYYNKRSKEANNG